MTNRVDICKLKNSSAWEYRIYIKGVRGHAKSYILYSSPRTVRRAAIVVGLAGGWRVFDCTKGSINRRQIWPDRP